MPKMLEADMIPSTKAPEIERLIDSITRSPYGRRGSITNNLCSWCSQPVTKFRDALSQKEYSISGFCQACQDKTFGGEE